MDASPRENASREASYAPARRAAFSAARAAASARREADAARASSRASARTREGTSTTRAMLVRRLNASAVNPMGGGAFRRVVEERSSEAVAAPRRECSPVPVASTRARASASARSMPCPSGPTPASASTTRASVSASAPAVRRRTASTRLGVREMAPSRPEEASSEVTSVTNSGSWIVPERSRSTRAISATHCARVASTPSAANATRSSSASIAPLSSSSIIEKHSASSERDCRLSAGPFALPRLRSQLAVEDASRKRMRPPRRARRGRESATAGTQEVKLEAGRIGVTVIHFCRRTAGRAW